MCRVCRHIVRLAFDDQAINPDVAAGYGGWSIIEDNGDLLYSIPVDPSSRSIAVGSKVEWSPFTAHEVPVRIFDLDTVRCVDSIGAVIE